MRFFKDESCKDSPITQISYDDEEGNEYIIVARTSKHTQDIGAVCKMVCATAIDDDKDIEYEILPDNKIQITGEDAGMLVEIFTKSKPRNMSEKLALQVADFLQEQKKTMGAKPVITEERRISQDSVGSNKENSTPPRESVTDLDKAVVSPKSSSPPPIPVRLSF